ncbi:MAG: ribulose-phosphate 3-epimerase [Candidatus Omnitrophica bacterium]|nr:ribulose-phosphate 3-epimerase [Candidatus Omnitrophota bacterium]
MNRVVPALLTDKKDDLMFMLNKCSEFTNYAQIDIMDGEFVPSKSIGIEDIENIDSPIDCEAHLMVKDPLVWIKPFKKLGAKKIIYHFEIGGNHNDIINKIKDADLKAGIALNPTTKIEEIGFLMKNIDMVLFMSVNPGFYGAPFIPEILSKIKYFKKMYPLIQIAIDGGMKLNNAKAAIDSGCDYICVGSAILKSNDPKQEYCKFIDLLKDN